MTCKRLEEARHEGIAKAEWYESIDGISRWEAIYCNPKELQSGHRAWVCRCTCGEIRVWRADILKQCKTSCPRRDQINLTGYRNEATRRNHIPAD